MNQKKTNYFSLILFFISIIFYLFFAFFDGVIICVDSPSYITMNISREPFYPSFLAFFRFLFGHFHGDFYLTVVVFAQSLLAAVAAWSLTTYLAKEFHLDKLFSSAILCIPFAISLLCRFAAQRGSMYSNSILTEGVAIPCFLLFFRYLIEYLLSQTKKSLALCCIFSFILISTRKQMIISLLLLFICLLTVYIYKKQCLKGIVIALLCTIFISCCNVFFDFGYNYVVRGEFVRHSSDTRFITTVAFYTADRSDSEYIEDENIRDLFLEIYSICEESGYLKEAAGSGWLNRVSHFGDHYDHIQIDTMWPLINEFASEYYGDNIVDLNEEADQIMDIINRSVIPHNIPQIIETFIDNFLSGLITTVAQRNAILIWYSIFVYLLYLFLLFYHLRKKQNKKILIVSIVTLLSIFFNVALVSLVIFCQTRYTIYNMALFYISLLLMIHPFSKHTI